MLAPMNKFPRFVLAALACIAILPAARADTSGVSPAGFVVTWRHEVAATPEVAWKAVLQLPRWWDGRHSWSGQAANMSLDAVAGGCWCERWGEGAAVVHGTVVAVHPGRLLRLNAALGPLQEMAVQGVLSFSVGAQDGKTAVRVHYHVAGGADAGLDKVAPPVDRVMGEQARRLVSFIETGNPAAEAGKPSGSSAKPQ
jgi:uncharacterized protein YndB with AHSA1/START domain